MPNLLKWLRHAAAGQPRNYEPDYNEVLPSPSAREAIVVQNPPTDSDGNFERIEITEGRNVKTVVCYRIYFEENAGKADLGTSVYPIPGTDEFNQVLARYDTEEERERQRKNMILSCTKTGVYEVNGTSAEWPKYGSVVLATPKQTGLLSETFHITPTSNRQALGEYEGLPKLKPTDPGTADFETLPGNDFFFENGKPIQVSGVAFDETNQEYYSSRGSITLADTSVNYECLTEEMKNNLNRLVDITGLNIVLTSAHRTGPENAATPGSDPDSYHTKGAAVDIRLVGTSLSPTAINSEVLTATGNDFAAEARNLGFVVVTTAHGTGPHIHLQLSSAARSTSSTACSDEELARFYTSDETGQ